MINIATDGSCLGNPGPGACGFLGVHNGREFFHAQPHAHTTNGEMEVRALMEALLYVSQMNERIPVTIHSDSMNVVKGYNEWMEGWKCWHKKGGLAHATLWQRIDELKSEIQSPLEVVWVRAHRNVGSLNDKVDALVNRTARTQQGSDSCEVARNAPADSTSPPTMQDLIELLERSCVVIKALSEDSDIDASRIVDEIGVTLAKAA